MCDFIADLNMFCLYVQTDCMEVSICNKSKTSNIHCDFPAYLLSSLYFYFVTLIMRSFVYFFGATQFFYAF